MTPPSYAMFWTIGEGPRVVGRVELDGDSVALSATVPTQSIERVGFRELASVLLERGSLHLARLGLPTIHIGSLDTPGALRELHDRLAEATQGAGAR